MPGGWGTKPPWPQAVPGEQGLWLSGEGAFAGHSWPGFLFGAPSQAEIGEETGSSAGPEISHAAGKQGQQGQVMSACPSALIGLLCTAVSFPSPHCPADNCFSLPSSRLVLSGSLRDSQAVPSCSLRAGTEQTKAPAPLPWALGFSSIYKKPWARDPLWAAWAASLVSWLSGPSWQANTAPPAG